MGVLVIGAAILVIVRPEISGWVVFGALALVAGVLAPLVPLLLLPLAVAFGSLISLTVHGINVGPTDLLVLALALGVLFSPRSPLWLETEPGSRVAPMRARDPAHGAALIVTAARRLWRAERLAALVFLTLVAYLAVICLSLAIATSRPETLKEIVKWSEVLVVTAAALCLAREDGRARLVAWTFITAGVAQALLGYGQWVLSTGDLGPGSTSIRVFGTFAQPNPYAGYLNFALLLALALVVFGEDARERWVAGAAAVLLLVAQVLANSRGGLLGLVAAVVVLAVVGWRRERLAGWVLLIGVPVMTVAWFAHLVPTRIENAVVSQFRLSNLSLSSGVTQANLSTDERLAHWLAGLRMFAAHPVLGVGAGNYNAAYAQVAVSGWAEPLGQSHNYYINVAAETGVLGLLAFLALTAVTLYLGWRVAHAAVIRRAPNCALALGFFAALVALAVHNLTDDLFVHAMELQVALCIGCLLALKVQERRAA